jgi:hypothetical protein
MEITMKRSRIAATNATVFALLLVGCATEKDIIRAPESPLNSYMEKYGFTAFTPFREGDGAGTIVSFDSQKRESIIFSPANCLKPDAVKPGASGVALLAQEYTTTSSEQLELTLLQLTKYQVNVAGAIGQNGVRSVSIKLIDPVTQRIERGVAKDFTRSLKKDSSCYEEVVRDGNLVIHTVLGARGVEYSFNGEGNQKLNLSVAILETIKLGPDISEKFKNKAGLQLLADPNKLMLFGYRAWIAKDVPNALQEGAELVALEKADIESLKRR